MARNVSCIDGSETLFVGPFHVEYAVGLAPRIDEYRLRYSVFVEERQWLSGHSSPAGLERDEFDDACCALLLRDASTGEPAACQRFILPERLSSGLMTNVELLAKTFGLDFDPPPSRSWVEVSRSTIAPKYRWGGMAATSIPTMVAIKYASVALAVALDRRTLFSISDPRTARLTRRLGFMLRQVGGPIEFHGKRALFSIDVAEVRQSVPADMRETVEQLIGGAAHALTLSR
jgi:N-acyl amino acid synthase of PEP-CTERM/exosortase system